MKPLGRLIPLALAASLSLALPTTSQAFWSLLGKAGSAAGKAGAGKAAAGAAGAAGAVGTAEIASTAAARAAKSADNIHPTGAPATAEQISAKSGLGPAVPPEVQSLLGAPGKTLKDVPDVGVRNWFEQPIFDARIAPAQKELYAAQMMEDYARLLDAKPALGPRSTTPAGPAKLPPAGAPKTAVKPAAEVPWYAVELVLRAAHIGHLGAQREAERLCQSGSNKTSPRPAHCKPLPATLSQAAKPR